MSAFSKWISIILILVLLVGIGVFANGKYMFNKNTKLKEAILSGNIQDYQDVPEVVFAVASNESLNGSIDLALKLYTRVINMSEHNSSLQALAYRNIGNIRFRKGIDLNGQDNTVMEETEYLFGQAKESYKESLRKNNSDWDVKHNLDRLNTIVKEKPSPGFAEAGAAGLMQGNIPPGGP